MGMAKMITLMMKTAMPIFPHPNPPPEGEGTNESLREFDVDGVEG